MKNVFTNTMKVSGLIAALAFTACTNRTMSIDSLSGKAPSDDTTAPIVAPTPERDFKLEKTVAALNAMQSVAIVTCANGTKGLRVVDEQGNIDDVACGGDKGDAGAQGPQGPQGVQGVAGAAGATGATGPQGPAGASGVKRLRAYNSDGTPTGMTYVVGEGTTGTVTLYHEASGLSVIYGRSLHPNFPNQIANTTNSLLYTTANCTGDAHMSFNVSVGNAVFRLDGGKYYKSTGVNPPSLATSRWDGTACQVTSSGGSVNHYVQVVEIGTTLPAGIPTTIKDPLKLVFE